MRRRLLIIHNAQAGLRQQPLLMSVVRHLTDAGADPHIHHAATLEEDGAIARAAVEAGTWDAVIAAGGDSTIRGVACGLIGSRLPLGIIPIGTGNVLAEELRLGRDAAQLAATLMNGPAIDIHHGLADQTPFLMMTGVGFDAHVVDTLNTSWKRSIGKLAYTFPVLRALSRKPEEFEVVIDGRTYRATWLVVTRTSHYGGSFVIADRQSLTDTGFHAIVTTAKSRAALASVLAALPLGRLARRRDVAIIACRHVRLPQSLAIPTQLDGERMETSPRDITLSDAQLSVIVPPASPLAVTARS